MGTVGLVVCAHEYGRRLEDQKTRAWESALALAWTCGREGGVPPCVCVCVRMEAGLEVEVDEGEGG